MKKKPCKECPFRKTSLAGWLGNNGTPEIFVACIDHEIIPCHMNIDKKEGKIKDGDINPCLGALQLCANASKLPRLARDPVKGEVYLSLIDQAKPNEEIFPYESAFIKHHTIQKK